MIKKLILISLIGCLIFSSGCAFYRVDTKKSGDWTATSVSVFKEIEIPNLGVTNSTTSIYVTGFSSKQQALKEFLEKALDKIK